MREERGTGKTDDENLLKKKINKVFFDLMQQLLIIFVWFCLLQKVKMKSSNGLTVQAGADEA